MKKKIFLIFFVLILTFLFSVIIIFEKESWPIGSSLAGIFIGILLPKLQESMVDLSDTTNWELSQRKLQRAGILTKDTLIRISFAYLYRIKVDGKYFLIKNARGTGKFQPVGGVYKFNDEEAEYIRNNFYAEDDDKIPIDESSKKDYRLRIKNKYFRKFVKRFAETDDREKINNLCREFHEELFGSDILNQEEFGDLSYNYSGRHFTELNYSKHFQCYELLMADILHVKLDDKQEKMFKELISKDHDDYMFASKNEIESLGLNPNYGKLKEIIADHSQKTLMERADQLIPQKKEPEIGTNFRCKLNS